VKSTPYVRLNTRFFIKKTGSNKTGRINPYVNKHKNIKLAATMKPTHFPNIFL